MIDINGGEILKILAIGDVCCDGGCEMLLRTHPRLKKEHNIDLTVVNGENSASQNGISPYSAQIIFNAGADVITGGNHTLHRRDIRPYIESNPRILRPHNLPDSLAGSGYCLIDKGFCQVAVINLLGQMYLESHEASNPFLAADQLIEKAKADGATVILVDLHAEATSEKRAMGFYLDGKVSAVFGTHTHVQTSDAQILPQGTAYITDLGMTGPVNSVLGVEPEIIIDRFKNGSKGRFYSAEGCCSLEGAIFTVDAKTGIAQAAETIRIF